jgi:hypothetical protein
VCRGGGGVYGSNFLSITDYVIPIIPKSTSVYFRTGPEKLMLRSFKLTPFQLTNVLTETKGGIGKAANS